MSTINPGEWPELLTPAEVGAMLRVHPRTVTRWAKAGKLTALQTVGGHRRFLVTEIEALLRGETPESGS